MTLDETTAMTLEDPSADPEASELALYDPDSETVADDAATDAEPEGAAEAEPDADANIDADIAAASANALARKRSKFSLYVVAVCIVALLALTVLGSLMNVGDHLMLAHPVLGWVFYGLIGVLVAVGVVAPVLKIAKRPIFSLYQLRDEEGHAKKRRCKMLVDNLVANGNLSDEDIVLLQSYLEKGDEADDLLIEFFKSHFIPVINDETKRAATTAFFISAVSHSPLVSTVTMLSICLDLVRAIVETCGYRPTNLGLARLYTRVMISALIIGGIEDSDLSDLLAQLMGGGAGARVGGIVLGATAEGVVSAFLVFRVGVLTKKWLTAEDGPARMSAIRRSSYREALSLMKTSGFMQNVKDSVKETASNVAASVGQSVADAARSKVQNMKDKRDALFGF